VDELPYVDEHAIVVAADTHDVWAALIQTLDGSFSSARARAYARAVGCAEPRRSGPEPLTEGATIPGFRVATAVPGSRLVLVGHHRFSSYALLARIEDLGDGTSRLRLETRAAFPGPTGGIYRMLVIGTGGHAAVVRRLLSRVERRACGLESATWTSRSDP
jgi:hypothetical protein